MTQIQWQANQIEAADDADLMELCYQNGWTDGLLLSHRHQLGSKKC